MINNIIIEIAKQYVGQEEIPSNLGFIDKNFEELMDAVGWKTSYAWCALFAELVWKEAYSKYDSTYIKELDSLFSALAVKTYINFLKSDWEVNMKPEPGCVVIWQNYKDGKPLSTGHAGIVIEIMDEKFIKTIEGNTNAKGEREGDGVFIKSRNYLNVIPTFKIKGFIHPKL